MNLTSWCLSTRSARTRTTMASCVEIGYNAALGALSPLAVVCFDGALAIPRVKPLGTEDSVLNHFNHILCALLLGGVLCEAVDRRDIVWGELHEVSTHLAVNPGESLNSHIHCQLRMRMASSFDTIRLSTPHNVAVSTFSYRVPTGCGRFAQVPWRFLRQPFLLRGSPRCVITIGVMLLRTFGFVSSS